MNEPTTHPCDCSEDYGPCEQHSTILVQREGSSARTADELAIVFIDDAIALGASLSRTAELDISALTWDGHWLAADPEGQSDTLYHYQDQIESDLYSLDTPDNVASWHVQRDDGYIISHVTGGPLAER